jgi:hypothetical protein
MDAAYRDSGNRNLANIHHLAQFESHVCGPYACHSRRAPGGTKATGMKLSSARTSPERRGPEKSGRTAIKTADGRGLE